MRIIILYSNLLHIILAAPQFLTLQDGRVGVNFNGYHASAGLGGLLTGNSAHGGLGASAGTPFGQQASAGLGGSLNGGASGLAYANAQAAPLSGGNVGGRTYARQSTNTILKSYDANLDSRIDSAPIDDEVSSIQKIKPSKKHSSVGSEPSDISAISKSKHLVKSKTRVRSNGVLAPPVSSVSSSIEGPEDVEPHYRGNIVRNALNIPIGILQSLQKSLSGLHA